MGLCNTERTRHAATSHEWSPHGEKVSLKDWLADISRSCLEIFLLPVAATRTLPHPLSSLHLCTSETWLVWHTHVAHTWESCRHPSMKHLYPCKQISLTACTLWVPHPLWPPAQTSPHNQQRSSVRDGAYMPQKACSLAHLSGISWVLLLVKFQCWYDWPWQLTECSCWTILPLLPPKDRTYSQLLKVLNLAVESEQGVLLLPGQGQLLTQLLCLLLVAVSGRCVRHHVQLALNQHAGDRATLSHHPQSQGDVTLTLTQSDVTLALTQSDVTLTITQSGVTLTQSDVTLALTQGCHPRPHTEWCHPHSHTEGCHPRPHTVMSPSHSDVTFTQRGVTLTQWCHLHTEGCHPHTEWCHPHPHSDVTFTQTGVTLTQSDTPLTLIYTDTVN